MNKITGFQTVSTFNSSHYTVNHDIVFIVLRKQSFPFSVYKGKQQPCLENVQPNPTGSAGN